MSRMEGDIEERLCSDQKLDLSIPSIHEKKVRSVSHSSCLIQMMKLKFLIKIGFKD